MTSATDVLRRLLDERGVFWVDIPRKDMTRTVWKERDGQLGYCYFDENECGVTTLLVSSPTPAQAIAATLGATDANPTQAESSGTCRITDNGPWGYPYVCSACGASFDPDVNNGDFNYCPNCGRRVEQ